MQHGRPLLPVGLLGKSVPVHDLARQPDMPAIVRKEEGEVELGGEPPLELLGGYEPAAQKRFTEVAAVVPLVLEGLAYVVFVDLAEGLISI